MDPTGIPNFIKDTASQAALVWAVTQVVKDQLRGWLGDIPANATRAIALLLSFGVAVAAFLPMTQPRGQWVLTVAGYAAVVLLPLAMAGHEVAQLGKAPDQQPAGGGK